MRNRWLRPVLAAAILFMVVVLIVIGCSMKKRATNVSANTPIAKSTKQTVSQKHRSERRRASVHDSVKPCDAAPVISQQSGNSNLQEDDSARALPHAGEATVTSQAVTSITRILVTVETERQPDPAFRLFQPPAQARKRHSDSEWHRFRPQAGQ